MTPSPRVCRAMVEHLLGAPVLTERQQRREARILAAAQHLLVHFGSGCISFRALATALRISTATLAWHYTDMDALLGEILRRHLRLITEALAAVPRTAANRQPLLRQAYLRATRSAGGGLHEAHILLTRDRHLLPEDERGPIEHTLRAIGQALAGASGPEALAGLSGPEALAGLSGMEALAGLSGMEVLDLLNLAWIAPDQVEPLVQALTEAQQPPSASQATIQQYPAPPAAAWPQAPPQRRAA